MATPVLTNLRSRLAAEDGLTLIEVAVTGLMVGLISLGLVGLDAAGKTSADQRRRSQAFEVAQADQERIKGLSADQISTLDQTRQVTMDSTTFTVTSSGQYLSSSADSASCSSPAAAADYAKVVSTVDWPQNARADVVVQSVLTPRAGGSLLAQVLDQNGATKSAVRIGVDGADPSTDTVHRFSSTDSGGCTIFGALPVGDYTVSPTLAGWVDKDGDSTPSSTVTTTAGNTTTVPFVLGQAGQVTANFATTIGSTTYTGQYAPSVSWFNAGMPQAINNFLSPSAPGNAITSTQNLFPFYVGAPGTYTSNYNVWAGKCMAAQPPSASRRYATVPPGGSPTMSGPTGSVLEPAMLVDVTYNGTRVKPAHVLLTDSCGQSWQPEVISTYTATEGGWLRYPGQPYGTYSICADYQFQGTSTTTASNFKKVTITNRANTSFTAQNSNTVPILLASSTGFC